MRYVMELPEVEALVLAVDRELFPDAPCDPACRARLLYEKVAAMLVDAAIREEILLSEEIAELVERATIRLRLMSLCYSGFEVEIFDDIGGVIITIT